MRWEEQMFPNCHLCCPGVSSSDSVPLPLLALAGLPAAGFAGCDSAGCSWASAPPGAAVLQPWCPRGGVTVSLLGVPEGEREAIGAALAACPEGNVTFAFFHLFGERCRRWRWPRPTAAHGAPSQHIPLCSPALHWRMCSQNIPSCQ